MNWIDDFMAIFGFTREKPTIEINGYVWICPKCNKELAVHPNLCVLCQNGWREEKESRNDNRTKDIAEHQGVAVPVGDFSVDPDRDTLD